MQHTPPLSWLTLLAMLLAPVGATAEQHAKPAATTVHATDPKTAQRTINATEQARLAEETRQKAARIAAIAATAEQERLRQEQIDATQEARAAEIAILAALAQMDALRDQQQTAKSALASRASAMPALLSMILRASLYPTETLLTAPGSPEDRVRGMLVLRGLAGQLDHEAGDLLRVQDIIRIGTDALLAETIKLNAAKAIQEERATTLDRLIADASSRREQAETEAYQAARRAADLAASAENLRMALAALEKTRNEEAAKARAEANAAEQKKARDESERLKNKAEAEAARRREAALAAPAGTLKPNAQPGGQFITPVNGTQTHAYNTHPEADRRNGVSFQTAPKARVVAPCGGRVAYAGKFRTYGQLLIIDCGGSYHAILAGLERIDPKVGHLVQIGEPVGVMPDANQAGPSQRPPLYLEIRHNGQPVDPAHWLRGAG